MQNLSFKSAMTVKPVEDVPKNEAVTSKTNQNTSNSQEDAGEQNSFQSLLNKQVQSKRGAEAAPVKPSNKASGKPSENANKNQKVDENTDSDANLNGSGDIHRTNIDSLVARLNTLRPETEGKESENAAEEITEKEEAEALEEMAALVGAGNHFQPQEMMAQALMRAQLQPAHAEPTMQKVEGQATDAPTFEGRLSPEAMTLATDSVHKELSANTLNNALSETAPSPMQGEQRSSGVERFKDVFSEKLSLSDLPRQDQASADLNAKALPALENAFKLVDSNQSKESFTQEMLKEPNANIGLQASQLAQTITTVPTAQTLAQAGASNQVLSYPGRTGWNQEISQKVVWMVGNGEQSATLTLNPPDLGPVQVVINVNNNQADAAFFSDNPEVRQALEDGLDYLRESMQSSGLQLGQANINAGQQQSQQSFQEMAQRQFSGAAKSPQAAVGADLPSIGMTLRESQGLVDTFA